MDEPSTVESTPRLRRAVAADAESIRQLVTAAYEHYLPLIGRIPIPMLADYDEAIRLHETWVLDEDDGIIGVLELDPRGDHLWLENIAVEPARQGRGLGRQLLEQAEIIARERALPEIRLLTNERYIQNIAMYERHGYRETHRRAHLGTDLVHFAKPVDLDRPSLGGVP